MTKTDCKNLKVGVLAFQGGVEEHVRALENLCVNAKKILTVQVKQTKDLKDLTHLIIPGGESSVIGRFMESSGLSAAIKKLQIPIWGTCAGAILLGRSSSPYSLNLIDTDLDRNAYGSQLQSFSTEIQADIAQNLIPAVFIRAPKIAKIGKNVKVLASHNGEPVFCQEGNILISTFHPELSHDKSILQYFLNL